MKQPIGYWARQVDQLFTAGLDAALAAHDLTRTHWQVLNSLAEGGGTVPRAQLAAGLAPFADPARIDEILADLEARGWADGVTLTSAGRAGHAAVQADVARFRARAMTGITPEEYGRTVDVLRRVAGNLV
jgi:DNA-binding MarR family transcriptional regulator